MNLFKVTSLICLIFITSGSFAQKIFYSSDADNLALKHNIIALAPPSVSIPAKKKMDLDALKEQQRTESINIQQEMYSWLMKRKMQGKINLEILDVETTNAKLQKAGYPETPLSPAEMAEILGVDAVVTSNFVLKKPISTGAAVAMNMLTNSYGPSTTNEVKATLSIHDRSSKKLIWNYDKMYKGSLGSTHTKLVNALMKNASKKIPYSKL